MNRVWKLSKRTISLKVSDNLLVTLILTRLVFGEMLIQIHSGVQFSRENIRVIRFKWNEYSTEQKRREKQKIKFKSSIEWNIENEFRLQKRYNIISKDIWISIFYV